MIPTAKADQWDKLTTMTFTEPVEIPGQILPAGTYVFKLIDSQTDRNVVEIFTQDQKQLVATVYAVPAYRLDPTSTTDVKFEERAAGSPEALHTWFYPGENYGLQFVYKKSEQQYAERSAPPAPPVATAAVAPTPGPEPAPVTVATNDTNSSDGAGVSRGTFMIGEEAPAPPAAPAMPQTLPQTAGNFALIPLLGLLLLSAGLATLRYAARQN